MTITKEDRDKFAAYLGEMEDVVGAFLDESRRAGYDLDFSEESLDSLEGFWLEHSGQTPDPEGFLQRAVRYYGEVYRKANGGEWRLSDLQPRSVFYGRPVIHDFHPADRNFEFCPSVLFRLFTVRQQRCLLRKGMSVAGRPG